MMERVPRSTPLGDKQKVMRREVVLAGKQVDASRGSARARTCPKVYASAQPKYCASDL